MTVSVMNRTPFPVLEIAPDAPVFDTHAKYSRFETTIGLPTDLRPNLLDTVKTVAVGAGNVRVDLILDSQGVPWVLEVNTIPGLTAAGFAPKAAADAGLNRAELCERMLESCDGRLGNRPRPEVADRRAA